MIYFPDENDDPASFSGDKLPEMAGSDALFVKVPFTSFRDKAPGAEESVVPVSKLTSDNPSREYKVSVGKVTIIIADCYGNEYQRLSKAPTADQLKGYLNKVSTQSEKMEDKLRKNLDKAKELATAGNNKEAVKNLLKNFKEGVVGLDAQNESITLYHELMDKVREQMKPMVEKSDKEGLKTLAKDYVGTDVEREIKDSLAGLK